MDRKHKPSALPASPMFPQPHVSLTNNVLTASLPSSPDTVTVNLYGATVTSWTASPSGSEQLFLSTAAKLDGSKPIRGGIPVVFPVFGPPPKQGHATSQLPQHGFARNNLWEFLGSSSSENTGRQVDSSVKLDFGLSSGMLDEETRSKWGYDFGLVYSVTLGRGRLECAMHVQNKGDVGFEFQLLLHSYLAVQDIATTAVAGLSGAKYVDKVRSARTFTESSAALSLTGETDRVYSTPASDAKIPDLAVLENNKPKLVISRDGLPDVTVWNLWDEKAKAMGDFEPKDGWKRFIAVEPGYVAGWLKLEAGDAWEGGLAMVAKL